MNQRDIHSYADPQVAKSQHVHLDVKVDFDSKKLSGWAEHKLLKVSGAKQLRLDVKHLIIHEVQTAPATGDFGSTKDWQIEPGNEHLGDALVIGLEENDMRIRVRYETTAKGSGLQWLAPTQTAGGKAPFLFSQSQAIHARTWFPCQDSPGVRVTYSARVEVPKNLVALMSAKQLSETGNERGIYEFEMPQAIPPYLIALAVGDLAFESLGSRSGVWAEPSVVKKAAREFVDTEEMMTAVEELYGPYRWERYDILVLPPSFPFGGMENPRLTFATPTILAGDRSLVGLIAHELAHSWSGNLVTNATWRDFWLNEGFTVYLEQRIMEAIFGRDRSNMETMLGMRELREEMAEMETRDQILHVDLTGRDPDDGMTGVPYDKGASFLRLLEQAFGRDNFDQFLREYFDHHAFQSITTEKFRHYLDAELFAKYPGKGRHIDLDLWIEKPGLPSDAPDAHSLAFEKIDELMDNWQGDVEALRAMPSGSWTTHEWLHFLAKVGESGGLDRMKAVDGAFALTQSGNSEITCAWLELALKNHYEPAYPRVESFLLEQGRRKFLKPLYKLMAKDPSLRPMALAIYKKARPLYHAISSQTLDEILR